MGYKLAEGKGLREGWDSKELWKTVEKFEAPFSENTLTSRLPSARLSLTPTTEGQDGEINSPLQEHVDGRGIEIG